MEKHLTKNSNVNP